MTPRRRVELECGRRGKDEVVAGCVALLEGVDPELIVALGGPPASGALTGAASGPDYWLRVWAARGLLWAWDDRAKAPIVRALRDDAWRVREGATRVVARQQVEEAGRALAALRRDTNPRVRAAAERATARLEAALHASRGARGARTGSTGRASRAGT